MKPRATAALSIVGTLSWLPMSLLPYEVTTLSEDFGFGTRGAGFTVTAELLVLALTAALFGSTIDRRDKRALTIIGVLLSAAASGASILVHQGIVLVFCRLLVGMGCGLIAAATNALPTLHRQPERVFAYMQVTLGIQFGLANYAMGVAARLGTERLFVVQLVFLVVLGACALLLPRGVMPESTRAAGPIANPILSKAVLACVASLALLWASLEASWAFAEQAAFARGLNEKSLVLWFTISGLTGPLGGLVAAALGDRFGYVIPLAAGFMTLMLSTIAMYCLGGYEVYVVGVLLFNAPIAFATSYLMALLAALDKTGRGASIGGAAANFGGAVGPLLGVMVLSIQNLVPVGIIAALLLMVGLGLSVWPARGVASAH